MYDMRQHGRLNSGQSLEQRKAVIQAATDQRLADRWGGPLAVPGTVNHLDADTPAIQREFFDSTAPARRLYAKG